MPTVNNGLYRWIQRRGATLEDFADRLNHFWTFGLLILLACITSLKQIIEDPIQCVTPSEFSPGMEAYVENVCWLSYFIMYPPSMQEVEENYGNISDAVKERIRADIPCLARGLEDCGEDWFSSTTVTFYQRLPWILFCQALLFKIPYLVMYLAHGVSGITFDKIASLTEGFGQLSLLDRHQMGRQTGRYIYNWCIQYESCLPWRVLTALWLFVKILYTINISLQLSVWNNYMLTFDPLFENASGFSDTMSANIFHANETLWTQSKVFPRRVFCFTEIYRFQRVQTYKLQCELPINEFNEPIAMFLTIWFYFVTIVTCVSFGIWVLRTIVPFLRKRFVARALFLGEEIDPKSVSQYDLMKFTEVLGEDGILALKLVGANSSEHVVRDAVCCMWMIRTNELKRPTPPETVSSSHL